jgi:hypothetical protein
MTLRMLNTLAIAGKLGSTALGLVVLRILLPLLTGDFAGVVTVASGLFTTHPWWGLLLVAGAFSVYFSRYPGLIETEGRPYLVGLAALLGMGGLGIAVASPTLAIGGFLLFAAVAYLWYRRSESLKREQRIGATVTPVIVHESHDRIRAVLGGRHLV